MKISSNKIGDQSDLVKRFFNEPELISYSTLIRLDDSTGFTIFTDAINEAKRIVEEVFLREVSFDSTLAHGRERWYNCRIWSHDVAFACFVITPYNFRTEDEAFIEAMRMAHGFMWGMPAELLPDPDRYDAGQLAERAEHERTRSI